MPSSANTPERRKRSRTWLGVVALLVGCSVCLLPGLLAGGVLGGALGWFGGAPGWVVGFFILLMLVSLFAYLRSRLKTKAEGTSCACGGSPCGSRQGT